MPRLFLGARTRTKPKKGGKRVRRHCPECECDADFVEVEVDHTLTAYLFVDLFTLNDEGYACTECHEVMDLDDTAPPKNIVHDRPGKKKSGLLGRMAMRQEQRQQEREARAAERAKQEAREQREAERAAKKKAVDDELEELKKKMGLS